MKKDTERYASERGLYLKLSYPCPTANTEEGEEVNYLERKSGL